MNELSLHNRGYKTIKVNNFFLTKQVNQLIRIKHDIILNLPHEKVIFLVFKFKDVNKTVL